MEEYGLFLKLEVMQREKKLLHKASVWADIKHKYISYYAMWVNIRIPSKWPRTKSHSEDTHTFACTVSDYTNSGWRSNLSKMCVTAKHSWQWFQSRCLMDVINSWMFSCCFLLSLAANWPQALERGCLQRSYSLKYSEWLWVVLPSVGMRCWWNLKMG